MKACLLGKICDNRDLLFCFSIRLKSNLKNGKNMPMGCCTWSVTLKHNPH